MLRSYINFLKIKLNQVKYKKKKRRRRIEQFDVNSKKM